MKIPAWKREKPDGRAQTLPTYPGMLSAQAKSIYTWLVSLATPRYFSCLVYCWPGAAVAQSGGGRRLPRSRPWRPGSGTALWRQADGQLGLVIRSSPSAVHHLGQRGGGQCERVRAAAARDWGRGGRARGAAVRWRRARSGGVICSTFPRGAAALFMEKEQREIE